MIIKDEDAFDFGEDTDSPEAREERFAVISTKVSDAMREKNLDQRDEMDIITQLWNLEDRDRLFTELMLPDRMEECGDLLIIGAVMHAKRAGGEVGIDAAWDEMLASWSAKAAEAELKGVSLYWLLTRERHAAIEAHEAEGRRRQAEYRVRYDQARDTLRASVPPDFTGYDDSDSVAGACACASVMHWAGGDTRPVTRVLEDVFAWEARVKSLEKAYPEDRVNVVLDAFDAGEI